MNRLYFILTTSALLLTNILTAQNWIWGKHGVAIKANDFGSPVATDRSGNGYLTGNFSSAIAFGPYNLSGNGFFIVKYDSNGAVKWAKQSTGDAYSDAWGTGIAVDSIGDVWVTGYFYDTTNFGTVMLKSPDTYMNAFIVKYDSSGNVLWAEQDTVPSSASYAYSFGVSIDVAGNAYITGSFKDTITFGSITLVTPTSYGSAFVVKYNSKGNVIWARQSLGQSAAPYAISSYKTGITYVAGNCNNALFGSYTLSSSGSFLVKYDSGGTVLWAKQVTGAVNTAYGVSVDNSDNAYVTGEYYDSARFDATWLKAPSISSPNVFIARCNSSGNFSWAKSSTDSLGWIGNSVSVDAAYDVFIGVYNNSSSADKIAFGTDSFSTRHCNYNYAAIVRLDSAGHVLCGSVIRNNWYPDIGGPGVAAYTNTAQQTSHTYVYLGGVHKDSVVFGPDTLLGMGQLPFISRWKTCGEPLGVNDISFPDKPATLLFPNPNQGTFTIQFLEDGIQNSEVDVYDMLGEKIYSTLVIGKSSLIINLGSQASGVYLYRIINKNGTEASMGKFIVK